MRVTVNFFDGAHDVATLHLAPSWWEWLLFGSTELDDVVVAVPAIRGGRLWVHDSTGRRVRSRRIVGAIELARRRARHEPRPATA